MSQSRFVPRVASPRARHPSVMFSVLYEDGRSAYFVAEGHGGPDQDFLALGIARERQRLGSYRKA